ncbi:MAG: AAA family ATPase [Oligoflexales bacterium]
MHNYILISLSLLLILSHNLFGSTKTSALNAGLNSTPYIQRHIDKIRPVIGNIGILVDSKISNGKEIAQAYASEIGASFLAYSGYSIDAVGSSFGEKKNENLESIFLKAKETAPTVLFISEFASLASSESYSTRSSKGAIEFIRLIREIVEEKNGVTVVVSDSDISKLDPVLWKERIFSAALSVETMNIVERQEILRYLADKFALPTSGIDFKKLGGILDSSVIADLEKIFNFIKSIGASSNTSPTERIVQAYERFSNVQKFENSQASNKDKRNAFEKEYDDCDKDFEVKKSNITFENVLGMKREKKQINEILRYFKEPEFFTKHGVYSPRGILLYGPPGNGKTYLARAIAGEVGANFISTTGADLESGIGKSDRISKLFAEARKNSPTVIFIDEFETIAGHRKNGAYYSDKKVSKLLTEMDGVDSETNEGVFVIAATNHLSAIDDAVLRPGRFDRHISVKIPHFEDRMALLNDFLDSLSISFDGDLNELVQLTAGLSIAHIRKADC